MEILIFIYSIVILLCFICEPIFINFIYLFNIDLFLDVILLKKKKDKLIKFILLNYKYDKDFDLVERVGKDV